MNIKKKVLLTTPIILITVIAINILLYIKAEQDIITFSCPHDGYVTKISQSKSFNPTIDMVLAHGFSPETCKKLPERTVWEILFDQDNKRSGR